MEYTKLSSQEKINGEKDLLQSQLGLLNALRHLNKYKFLRKQESYLKISLKSKIDESLHSLSLFDKLLPRIQKTRKEENELPLFQDNSSLSLDQEVALIKKKLASLN